MADTAATHPAASRTSSSGSGMRSGDGPATVTNGELDRAVSTLTPPGRSEASKTEGPAVRGAAAGRYVIASTCPGFRARPVTVICLPDMDSAPGVEVV